MKLKHIERLIKKIKYYPLFLVYFLSRFVKRDKNIWVFGTYNNNFNDNSKYLYLYIKENNPEITPIWITKKKKYAQSIRDLGVDAYYKYSLKGICYLLKAKFYFTNTNLGDLSFWLSGGAVYFNLWHGLGLKNIEFNITTGPIAWKYQSKNSFSRFIKKLSFPALYRSPDHLLVPSDYTAENVLHSAFRIGKKESFCATYPRNAIFDYDKSKLKKLIERFDGKDIVDFVESFNSFNKVFMYLPTFRDGKKGFLVLAGIKFDELNDVLKEKNNLLIVKLHPNVKLDAVDNYSNIIFMSSGFDIHPILPFTDSLITDYSSIYSDYLLLDKEIIFYCFDLEEYLQDSRGISYDYSEVTPGKKCYNFEELLDTIINFDDLDYSVERERVRNNLWGESRNFGVNTIVKTLMEKY